MRSHILELQNGELATQGIAGDVAAAAPQSLAELAQLARKVPIETEGQYIAHVLQCNIERETIDLLPVGAIDFAGLCAQLVPAGRILITLSKAAPMIDDMDIFRTTLEAAPWPVAAAA